MRTNLAELGYYEVTDLLHLLWHTSRGRRRAKPLRFVLDARRDHAGIAATEAAIVTREASEAEETFLHVIEEATTTGKPVHLRFYSTERGAVEPRHASVHRVDVGPPSRLVATCHRTNQLKWFRVDNIVDVRADRAFPSSTPAMSSRDRSPPRWRGGPLKPCRPGGPSWR
jgi:predicted DNA-binding transcriptional regulator YafY